MRQRWVSLVALVSSVLLLLAPAVTTASNPCAGSISNWFDGLHTNSAFVTYGSWAYIQTNAGAVCTGGAMGTSAGWAMIADKYPNGTGYAQAGFDKINTGQNRHFAQWRRSAAFVPTTVWGANASGVAKYEAGFNQPSQLINMWVGGTLLSTTNFNPLTAWSSPWDSQYFGETWRLQDDMPGTVADHTNFTQVRYHKDQQVTGVWAQPPSGVCVVTDAIRYKQSCTTTDHFDIWTDPLH